jgi:hypothetical protein
MRAENKTHFHSLDLDLDSELEVTDEICQVRKALLGKMKMCKLVNLDNF